MTGIVVTETPDGPVETLITDLDDDQLAQWAALGNVDATRERFRRFTVGQQSGGDQVVKGRPYPGQRFTHGWKPVAGVGVAGAVEEVFGQRPITHARYLTTRTTGDAAVQKRHVPGQPYRYRHGWISVEGLISEADLSLHDGGTLHATLHEDGGIHLAVAGHGGASDEWALDVEDVPDLVDGLDTMLAQLTSIDEPHRVMTTTGDVTFTPRQAGSGFRVQFPTPDGTAHVDLNDADAEQLAQTLEQFAADHHPTPIATYNPLPGLGLDLLSNDTIGIRLGGEDAHYEAARLDGDELRDLDAALTTLAQTKVPQPPQVRTGLLRRPKDDPEFDRRTPVAARRVRPGMETVLWSDHTVSVVADNTTIDLPLAALPALQHTLRELIARTTPNLTAKGARLVRMLAKQAAAGGVLGKDHEGKVGEYRARHLIRWFERGADGQIPWGSPGDFMACVRVASRHMTVDQAKGFCNLRHHGALGIYPATHAARERGGKGKKKG